ncbi:mannitol dehydrogenase family protein [Azospirillum halopraeferens]|uniref:mannitol dehydrogenase family protein n=1 Tax=Azospirillum halopraeferens TaxID=34010 RepID=UPI000557509F|nr:mannitol dehydrogenase family protein [Azospirillum halopraeferens]
MRLNARTLGTLPDGVRRPRYDRAGLETGIVHIGLGAFHRAHQAVYTEDALDRAFGPWGICGVSLRSPETRDALAPQDDLYTVLVRDAGGERARVVGSVTESLVAPEDPAAVLERLVRPSVRVVTVTVTEKGYCHEPATGALDERHPGIVADIANPGAPQTLPGFLVEALARRRAAGTAPFTVLSCDNLPENGVVTAGILRRFAELRDPALARWIEDGVACPSSMVDRIVPATTAEDRAAVARLLGVEDAWPVVTEPFSQWVIEDRFPAGRPAWETVGAELTADVRPFERMKLRLLNASHSCMAYLGYLSGYETVAQTIADPAFARFVAGLMDAEVTPTLAMPAGVDLAGYKAALLRRFANPALKHRTWQIAMDGSQKLPQRLLGTIADRLAAGAPIDRLALGVAGWMRYVSGTDEQGRPIDVRDPLAARLRALADEAGPSASRLAPALLGVGDVFGGELPHHPEFVRAVTDSLDRLFTRGARACVEAAAGEARTA